MPSSTSTKARVVFFGSSNESALILEDLLQSKSVDVVAAVTQPGKKHGHTHQQFSRVAHLAQAASIPVYTPQKLTEITAELAKHKPTVGVLFAYGKLLPDETLQTFPYGIVNIHPSLLPKHRGPAPLEATILAGDTMAGTSIMLISTEMDAGPILAQKSFAIDPAISKQDLWDKLLQLSREILLPTLLDYLAGIITPQPQNPSIEPTYSRLLRKTDGNVDPHAISTLELARLVRAYAGWPGVRVPVITRNKKMPLTLHEIQLISNNKSQPVQLTCQNKQLVLDLADGSVEILRAQLPNKSIVTGRDLCNAGQISLD